MLTKKDAKMAQGLAIIGMVALHLFCKIDNLPYNAHIFLGGKTINLLYRIIWRFLCSYLLFLQWVCTTNYV